MRKVRSTAAPPARLCRAEGAAVSLERKHDCKDKDLRLSNPPTTMLLRLFIYRSIFSYTLSTRVWGVVYLYTNIEERACDLAAYIIDNRATVRSAATEFGISKSTVHTAVM